MKGFLLKMETKQIEVSSVIIRNIMRELLKGLSEIHSKRIVHRDLKPENVIIQVKGS